MLKRIFLITGFLLLITAIDARAQQADPYTIDLARSFGKDIFELNGIPYLQPVVEAINSTSNSRFFNQAFVPREVEKPYFRIGVHSMFGFVPESKKTYSPQMPRDTMDVNRIGNYVTYDPFTNTFGVKDTVGLINYAFKIMVNNGIEGNSIHIPQSAATALGNKKTAFDLPHNVMDSLLKSLTIELPIIGNVTIYDKLPLEMQRQLDTILKQFPEHFNLSDGGNIDYLIALVPQVEIGSFMGTELLLRFIPPIELDETVGKFAFWGIGVKHSVSQYFNESEETDERMFDLAVQAVYQGTHLENSIGVTNSQLKADATIWDFNIHASKSFKDILDVYTGFSYELINIKSDYTYYLPVELQWALGMLEQYHFTPTPGYPGDTKPQKATVELDDTNFKWVIGVSKQIGPVAIFFDYSVCKNQFNIFSGGVEYRF